LEFIREVVESFVRLAKSEIHPSAVLVCADDMFEVTETPSVVLQGPTLSEDSSRRSPAMLVRRNQAELTFEQCKHPRLYHLDFDVIVTTGKEAELLDLTEKVARFYQLHPAFSVGEHGSLNIAELVPLGGLKRVNLSNLRQASGRCRIEDCPIYDGRVSAGKLTTGVKIEVERTGDTP
jgi:hypothetical protein